MKMIHFFTDRASALSDKICKLLE